ncbi:hypothetical protein D9M71_756820 [compost metagenome]
MAYTVCLFLKKDELRASKIRTIANGYKNIKTGIAYLIILFKPKFAIVKDTAHNRNTNHL